MTKPELIEFLKSKGYVGFKEERQGELTGYRVIHTDIGGFMYYVSITGNRKGLVYVSFFGQDRNVLSGAYLEDLAVVNNELVTIDKMLY